MKRTIIPTILAALMLSACQTAGYDHGYSRAPLDLHAPPSQPMIVDMPVANRDVVAEYCFTHRGRMTEDGAGCSTSNARYCVRTYITTLPSYRTRALIRQINADCNGFWYR